MSAAFRRDEDVFSRPTMVQRMPKRLLACPICGKLGSLRLTDSAMTCTHCQWRMMVKQSH
jgi:DNA-directed RNA polymerase subunit RPC12/RpoP